MASKNSNLFRSNSSRIKQKFIHFKSHSVLFFKSAFNKSQYLHILQRLEEGAVTVEEFVSDYLAVESTIIRQPSPPSKTQGLIKLQNIRRDNSQLLELTLITFKIFAQMKELQMTTWLQYGNLQFSILFALATKKRKKATLVCLEMLRVGPLQLQQFCTPSTKAQALAVKETTAKVSLAVLFSAGNKPKPFTLITDQTKSSGPCKFYTIRFLFVYSVAFVSLLKSHVDCCCS